MDGRESVVVCRLSHRPGRDDRMTTHVGLTARALGADRVVLPDNATGPAETVEDITGRFGGPFGIELRDAPKALLSEWSGTVAHLTMYGLPVQDVEADLRAANAAEPLLVVVGGEKVPFEVYDRADYNVAVTSQHTRRWQEWPCCWIDSSMARNSTASGRTQTESSSRRRRGRRSSNRTAMPSRANRRHTGLRVVAVPPE